MAPPPLKKWKILSHKHLTHDVFEVRIEKHSDLVFKAGQYMSIVIPGAGPGGRNLRRAYSIASPPEFDHIELCVKKVDGGPGTSYLYALKPGDEIEAQAPFGDFVIHHEPHSPTMFLGTGTGLAPLRAMVITKAWQAKAPVAFFLGVREEKDILYPELFPELDATAPFKDVQLAKICLSRANEEWQGFRGRITDYVRELDNKKMWDFAATHYYLCGSGAMLTEIKDFLMNHKGIPKAQIHTEKYY